MSTAQPLILLTTDGSDDSLTAVEPTCELAERLGARLILLSVVCESPMIVADHAALPLTANAWKRDVEAEVETMRRRLELIAAGMRHRLPGAGTVEVVVMRGECPDAVITSLAAVRQVGFIAMASHGRSGLRRLLLGSVTEQVIRRATVPVIVYPVTAQAGAGVQAVP